MMIRFIGALLLFAATAAQAQLNVVATTAPMGMLASAVGGEQVRVRVLAPANRDTHYLTVRPQMMAALRTADLLVAVGAELEIGWLPPATRGAGNRRVYPGQPGYFEAAAEVDLIDAHGIADRALGDVHPGGNPHLYLDPLRMGQVALALAERLALLRPQHAEDFRANAHAFADQAQRRVQDWQSRAAGAPGVVLYHADADYLLRLLSVPVLGYLEPVPGVPPTASHLRGLAEQLRGRQGVVVYYPYQSPQHARFLADRLGWKAVQVETHPPVGGGAGDYFAVIDNWVRVLESATGR
jgi:zinc/manganese transport system substrate-binding protein